MSLAGARRGAATVCSLVVGYTCSSQARAAEELARLPQGSAIALVLSDYPVMREQERACL